MRDVYHDVYLLNRAPGFPSCGEATRRRAIQEILSSLQDRLQRQTSCTEAGDALENERESALQTYEVALQIACQKVVETTAALQSNLDRLNNELRGRSLPPQKARISRCAAEADSSYQGLLPMPAALGGEKPSAGKPRGPSFGRECKGAMSNHG